MSSEPTRAEPTWTSADLDAAEKRFGTRNHTARERNAFIDGILHERNTPATPATVPIPGPCPKCHTGRIIARSVRREDGTYSVFHFNPCPDCSPTPTPDPSRLTETVGKLAEIWNSPESVALREQVPPMHDDPTRVPDAAGVLAGLELSSRVRQHDPVPFDAIRLIRHQSAELAKRDAELATLRTEFNTFKKHWSEDERDLNDLLAENDRLRTENAALQTQVEGHCERIAKQSDLLSRRAEG